MGHRQLPVVLIAALLTTLVVSSDVNPAGHGASSERTDNMFLGTAVLQAEFIFHGTVSDIQYRLSDAASPGDVRLPHTFVTYTIEEVLKGTATQNTVTLRFMGGPDEERGKFFGVSDVPLFTVGDQDILFVRKNGTALCPLVRCGEGRFRVVGEQLYSYDGRAVSLDQHGRVLFGAPAAADDQAAMHLSPQQPVKTEMPADTSEDEAEPLDQDADQPQQRAPDRGQPHHASLTLQEFTQAIVDQAAARAATTPVEPVHSVDIQEKFYIRTPQPAAPGVANPAITAPTMRQQRAIPTEQDQAEEELMKRQGGNPVLR
jgi:hypothetical protein